MPDFFREFTVTAATICGPLAVIAVAGLVLRFFEHAYKEGR